MDADFMKQNYLPVWSEALKKGCKVWEHFFSVPKIEKLIVAWLQP